MRLWTIHPSYLDTKGLVAVWREALLAQKVLRGETRGYTRHPQLVRFRDHPMPLAAIAAYLNGLALEADRRGFRFDKSRIVALPLPDLMEETEGQLLHEWNHLLTKIRMRSPEQHALCRQVFPPKPHPLFRIVAGDIKPWEKISTARVRR